MTQTRRSWLRRWALVAVCALLADGATFWLLWSWSEPRPRLTLKAPAPQRILGFSGDQRYLMTLSQRNRWIDASWGGGTCSEPVIFWDVRTGQPEMYALDPRSPDEGLTRFSSLERADLFAESEPGVTEVMSSADGSVFLLFISACRTNANNSIWVYDRRKGCEVFQRQQADHLWPVELSPDGKWLLLSLGDGVQLFELSSGRAVKLDSDIDLRGEDPFVADRFSPDSQWLVCWNTTPGQQELVFWDLRRQRVHWRLPGIFAVYGFTPSGHRLLVGKERRLVLLDVETGKDAVEMQHENGWTLPLKFSRDGRRLVGQDVQNGLGMCCVNVWDANTGNRLRDFEQRPVELLSTRDPGPFAPILAVSPFPAEKTWTLSTVAIDKCLGIWPACHQPALCSPDGQTVVTCNYPEQAPGPIVQRLQGYLPDFLGRVWNPQPSVRLWNVSSLEQVTLLRGQQPVCFSPDGSALVTYDSESQAVINIWDMPPRTPIFRSLAWSLLVSLFVTLLGCWFVTRRSRPKETVAAPGLAPSRL